MKRNTQDETPAHIPGLAQPAIFVEGAAIMFRGGCCRLAMCEGSEVRVVLMMQTFDAVAMAQQIIAGRDEMLAQTLKRAGVGPSSPIGGRPSGLGEEPDA